MVVHVPYVLHELKDLCSTKCRKIKWGKYCSLLRWLTLTGKRTRVLCGERG